MMLDESVRNFYEESQEQDRLLKGIAQLEAHRTRQILKRFLPSPPAVVLDVGGGAGAYALWLAEQGYHVDLIDPVESLVAVAGERSRAQQYPLASHTVGDARRLDVPTASVDVALLLGPLYHLPILDDRLLALREARRVLKPDGILMAAAMTRWATVLYGLANELFANSSFDDLAWESATHGKNRNTNKVRGGFTTAYFHRPDELRIELREAGFSVAHLFGVEGPACLLTDFERRWANDTQRTAMLRTATLVEEEESVIGTSAHLIAVAQPYPHVSVGAG